MSRANIDVRVMASFPDVVHGVPNGDQHQKDAQWIEKSLRACVGRVMLVAKNPPVLFLRTCHLPVHEHVAGGSWRSAPTVCEHIELGLRL